MYLGALTRRSVHPASPVLLTRTGPLTEFHSVVTSLKNDTKHTNLEFESRPRALRPWLRQSFALPDATDLLLCSYPEGDFGGNQLLDCSIGLSPLYQDLTSDLHVSIAADFHQTFARLHPALAKFAIFRVVISLLGRGMSRKDSLRPGVLGRLSPPFRPNAFATQEGFYSLPLAG